MKKKKKKEGRLDEKLLHPQAVVTRAHLMHDVIKATLKCHSAGGHGGGSVRYARTLPHGLT